MPNQLGEKEPKQHRRLRRPADAAEYLGGVVTGTLAKWRHFGCGPEYMRIGSRIFYEESTLDAWLDARRRSTSEAA